MSIFINRWQGGGRRAVPMDFFVSYNKADRAWAEWIAWRLEEAGYATVLQAWDFRPGTNFALKMHEASAETERTVAVLSPDYLASGFTAPEWAEAFADDPTGEKGLLLPVRVRHCEPTGMLRQVVYVDLVGLDEAAAKKALLAGVQRGRAKPSHEPGFPGAAGASPAERPQFPGAADGERPPAYERVPERATWKWRARRVAAIVTMLFKHRASFLGAIVFALVLYQLYRGYSVQKIGIPDVLEIEFDSDGDGGDQASNPTVPASPTPAPLLFEDFTDTSRWYYSRRDWVQPISSEGDEILRFYPPANRYPVGAYREPMDDVPLGSYCSVQFAIRLGLQGGARLGDTVKDAAVYLEQAGEKKAAPLATKIDQDSSQWQTITMPLSAVRGVDTNAFYDAAATVTKLGFEFSLPTAGSTIDIDDVYLLPCT